MKTAVMTPELSDPIAIRIPGEVLSQIEAVAVATERTRGWVMVRALRYYLGGEGPRSWRRLGGVVKSRRAIRTK